MRSYSIASINSLSEQEKRDIFIPLIPPELFERFSLPENLIDPQGNSLMQFTGSPGAQSLELRLYHEFGFEDPLIYSHLADTLNVQIHILLYIMNDPSSPRYNTDRLPDGTKTEFGTRARNIPAELTAMQAGLLPGQLRKGLNLLAEAVVAFETFVSNLRHTMYFVEPLFYHNAIIFERYGFNYQTGRRKMEEINNRFQHDESLIAQLGSSPFRDPKARESIFHRSWALHDGILGEKFDGVTMYKVLGKTNNVNTTPDISW